MKPAVCFLCGKLAVDDPSDNKGDWVEFADYQQESSSSLDHPDGLEYVCEDHLASAKQLSKLNACDALLELQNKYGQFDEETTIN